MRCHVFEYHNRIIHHHTDSNRKGRKRDNINRIPGNSQINKGGNQRKRNRDTDNQGCTPASQEKEHDNDNEQQSIHYGFRQTINRVQDIVRRINNHSQLHVTRQVFLQTGKCLFYLAGNFYRIGTRLFLNNNHSSLHTVVIGFLRTLLYCIDDTGNVT